MDLGSNAKKTSGLNERWVEFFKETCKLIFIEVLEKWEGNFTITKSESWWKNKMKFNLILKILITISNLQKKL